MDKASIEKARDLLSLSCMRAKMNGDLQSGETYAMAAAALSWVLEDGSVLDRLFPIILDVEAQKYALDKKAQQN